MELNTLKNNLQAIKQLGPNGQMKMIFAERIHQVIRAAHLGANSAEVADMVVGIVTDTETTLKHHGLTGDFKELIGGLTNLAKEINPLRGLNDPGQNHRQGPNRTI